MGYYAHVLLDSITEQGDRLTTMEVCFPRIVLAEFNTHRVFSRNSASSRAIPIEKMIERVERDPYVPEYWGKNQSGMQADEAIPDDTAAHAEQVWRDSLANQLAAAKALADLGVHKQLSNRLLEPFMWHTVIVTATEWSNFFALRANKDAQPEIQRIARLMQDAYRESKPRIVQAGEWHLPLLQPDEQSLAKEDIMQACKISAARCARVSYLTHDGKRDIAKDIELYDRLVSAGHMSPLEHVATPLVDSLTDLAECVGVCCEQETQLSSAFCGNFRGWKQLRKHIPYESDFSKRPSAE